MTSPGPAILKVTGFSVIGRTRPCASCTSTVQIATSSPSAEIAMRCQTETKPKQETCKGAFQLVKDGFVQPGELVLRRAIK